MKYLCCVIKRGRRAKKVGVEGKTPEGSIVQEATEAVKARGIKDCWMINYCGGYSRGRLLAASGEAV